MTEALQPEDHMIQAHDLGESYDDVLSKFRASLDDARRHWLAYMLVNYPHRDILQVVADQVRLSTGAKRVEINAIYERAQVTVACAPSGMRQTIRDRESLCVLTASTGWALAVDDITTDPITQDHPARARWGSWASVPLMLQGRNVGSICALEEHPREWTRRDEDTMTHIATRLSSEIEDWIESERRDVF